MTRYISPASPLTNDAAFGMPPTDVQWVTKTNVTDYHRCPRAYWLIARGQITHEESISPYDLPQVDAGVEFERGVVAGAPPADLANISPAVELSTPGQPTLVLQSGLWANEDLGLRGEPDGVEIASGAWAPVEVKHHARPTSLDRLELAFYWLLLAPQRSDDTARPHGYLVLDGPDGPADPVRVELRAPHFTQVGTYVDAVRRARSGPEPYGCGRCYVCTTARPQSREVIVAHREDLANLFWLGDIRARQLPLVGIESCADLLALGCDEILDRVAGHGWGIGRYHVEGWIAHAQAWTTDAPVIYGDPPPMPDECIALDLEYLRQGEIWLAGMRPVGGELTQFWSWAGAGEADLMRSLANYWAARPETVMATWWGIGADVPALRRASERTGVEFSVDPGRHFDLYHWVMGHLRLPVRYLSLKDVGGYFGVLAADHGIGSGDEAVAIYLQAARARRKKTKAAARARLESYNAEDIDAVIRLIELLRATYPQAPRQRPQTSKPAKQGPARAPKRRWRIAMSRASRKISTPRMN